MSHMITHITTAQMYMNPAFNMNKRCLPIRPAPRRNMAVMVAMDTTLVTLATRYSSKLPGSAHIYIYI